MQKHQKYLTSKNGIKMAKSEEKKIHFNGTFKADIIVVI